MKKIPKPKYKVGDEVLGRIIKQVEITREIDGKTDVHYGYIYPKESEDSPILWCTESTLVRKLYR